MAHVSYAQSLRLGAGGLSCVNTLAKRRPLCCLATRLACVLTALAATGCGGPTLPQIVDTADFHKKVLASQRPVLVEFYKDGCPTCVVLEPKLARLGQDYQDRLDVAKFQIMTSYFAVTAPEIKDRYDISYFPTVILFVENQPRKRWVLEYNMDKYRMALDELGPAPAQESSVSP